MTYFHAFSCVSKRRRNILECKIKDSKCLTNWIYFGWCIVLLSLRWTVNFLVAWQKSFCHQSSTYCVLNIVNIVYCCRWLCTLLINFSVLSPLTTPFPQIDLKKLYKVKHQTTTKATATVPVFVWSKQNKHSARWENGRQVIFRDFRVFLLTTTCTNQWIYMLSMICNKVFSFVLLQNLPQSFVGYENWCHSVSFSYYYVYEYMSHPK